MTKEHQHLGTSYVYDEDCRVPTEEESKDTSVASYYTSGDDFATTNQVTI